MSTPHPTADHALGKPLSGWRLRLYTIIFEADTRAGQLFDRWLIALILTLSTGCATVKNWFGSNKNKAIEPAELVEIANPIDVDAAWSRKLGSGQEKLGLRQRPVPLGRWRRRHRPARPRRLPRAAAPSAAGRASAARSRRPARRA